MNAVEKALTKIFGSANERLLKKLWPIVAQINSLESSFQSLSDDQLRAKTVEFKERIAKRLEGSEDLTPEAYKLLELEALEEIMPEAFACVREASVRVTGMRHFDVQLIGGMALNKGMIAEMRTGEGKTLVATLPTYLNALVGKGVHVITVNDYLARRDAEWMGRIYKFLGLTVGIIQHDLEDGERQAAYNADITYGTNNEFGFDYLRDNMKFDVASCVQRGHHFAAVDEVDSILIDEARTPLIISGASEDSTTRYYDANDTIPRLTRDVDYQVDEKQHSATLTEAGIEKSEQLLRCGNLYDPSNMEMLHCLQQALVAHTLYQLDKNYIIKDSEVVIVDEFTGRVMPGRRWSDGLHQAVEAKEGVKIEKETQTYATITLQNYFRMYHKLCGMTGTAETESVEFAKIYNLDVTSIPTHRPMVRKDKSDVIYRTLDEKWDAITEEIKELHEKGQPVLVGTASVENSEIISRRLQKVNIKHNLLNAKPENAGREAEFVAQAGRKGAVTIATNMAGRGTDILLGGNADFLGRELLKRQEVDPNEATEEQLEAAIAQVKPGIEIEHNEVTSLGGLYILGSERHESRRIDNQLRGRSGRQGDPGESRFFLSLEDDLMRIFAGDRLRSIMQSLGMEKGVAIESKLVSKRIEAAQKNVEAHNFTIREHLIKYDDVMNKQRSTIYTMRRDLLDHNDFGEQIQETAEAVLENILELHFSVENGADVQGLKIQLLEQFGFDLEAEGINAEGVDRHSLHEAIWTKLKADYAAKEEMIGAEGLRYFERYTMLNIVDAQWKDHLLAIDHLKEGINLRGYGQKDPLVEYKKESFAIFEALLNNIDRETVKRLYRTQFVLEAPPQEQVAPRRTPRRGEVTFSKPNASVAAAGSTESGAPKTYVRNEPIVGRNDPCPCGSGKKYKKCHGVEA